MISTLFLFMGCWFYADGTMDTVHSEHACLVLESQMLDFCSENSDENDDEDACMYDYYNLAEST